MADEVYEMTVEDAGWKTEVSEAAQGKMTVELTDTYETKIG